MPYRASMGVEMTAFGGHWTSGEMVLKLAEVLTHENACWRCPSVRWVGWGSGVGRGVRPVGQSSEWPRRPCRLQKVLYAVELDEATERAAEGAGALLSWCPDLARCLGPSSFSLFTPLSSYSKAPLFSERLASFFMKSVTNFLIPFRVPPKSQP